MGKIIFTDKSIKNPRRGNLWGESILQLMRFLNFKIFILTIFSGFLIYFLTKNINTDDIINILKNSNPLLILISFILYFTTVVIKAGRLHFFFRDYKMSFKNLLIISSYHNFFNLILPARTGEFTYLYFLKKIGKQEIGSGMHSLLFLRFLDLIAVVVFLLVSLLLFFGNKLPTSVIIVGFAIILLLLLLLIKFNIVFTLLIKIFNFLMKLFRLNNFSVINTLLKNLTDFKNYSAESNSTNKLSIHIILSIILWINLYTFFYINILSFGVDTNFLKTIIGSTGGVLISVLPINSFASLGTFEAGWTGSFILTGMTEKQAILSGFGVHLISIISAAFSAFIFYLTYIFSSNKNE